MKWNMKISMSTFIFLNNLTILYLLSVYKMKKSMYLLILSKNYLYKIAILGICIYPTPLHEQDVMQGQYFKLNGTGLNSEFFFSLINLNT